MPQTEQVMSFIDKLGFFYEIVDENDQPIIKSKQPESRSSHLSPSNTENSNDPIANGVPTHHGGIIGNGYLSNGMVNGNRYDYEHPDVDTGKIPTPYHIYTSNSI